MEVPIQLSADWKPVPVPGLPNVFTGGWVGFCGYDTVRYVYAGLSVAVLYHSHKCLHTYMHTVCTMQASCRFRAPHPTTAACLKCTLACTKT